MRIEEDLLVPLLVDDEIIARPDDRGQLRSEGPEAGAEVRFGNEQDRACEDEHGTH